VATKTTFLLDDELRAELKAVAARRGRSVTELLTEGARMVLDHYRGRIDRDELARRAAAARARLRDGLYEANAVADDADSIVYGRPSK
jgi:hypothetical protein